MLDRLACVCSLLCVAASASADVIAFRFSGEVTDVGLPAFGLSVSVGTPVEGTFAYESTLVDQTPEFANYGAYRQFPPYRLSVDIGSDRIWSGEAFNLTVSNDVGSNVEDSLVLGSNPTVVNGVRTRTATLGLDLASTSTGIFDSDALPTTLDASDFDRWRYGVLVDTTRNRSVFSFSIDEISLLAAAPPDPGPGVAAVPAPPVTALIGAGLFGLFACNLRTRGIQARADAPRR